MSDCHYSPYHIYSSAVQSTAIEQCVSGHFTSEIDLNLIIAKNSRIEIFLVAPEGLSPMKEVKIYGKIAVMLLFRPQNAIKDYLFILTSKYNAMILESKVIDGELEIHSRAHGNVADRVGKISEKGVIAVIDPDCRVIGLRICDGLLNIIPLESNDNELKAVNMRIEEFEIQDLNFLHGCLNPTIILLHQDQNGRHIKTHEFCLKEKEFIKVPWKQDNIEMEASMIIPVPEPLCGAIIIGQESILYHEGSYFVAVAPSVIRFSPINCFAYIDSIGQKYILGDLAGHLFVLLLEIDNKADAACKVKDIKIDLLGEVSIPECITYLDNGVLFIGSKMGDSQLVKLNNDPNSVTGSHITILETFVNLAPIIDMVVVDLEKQGQCQLITCSGGFKDGSLRIIRTGIGIHENANIELPGIKGMWSINVNNSDYDDMLVLSFVGHTRVLSLIGEEFEEIEIFGFNSDQQTILCNRIGPKCILQITPKLVSLISLEPVEILSTWILPFERTISLATCCGNQIVCTAGNEIFYLEIVNAQIVEQKGMTLEHEVSCVDITALSDEHNSNYVAFGLWNDISVRIFKLPSLEEIYRENLGGETISRSLLFATFEGINYLFCALGDGNLFHFIFERYSGQLMDKKRVTLGTQPVLLKSFKCINATNVFVCSDRPTVIHSSSRKLVFSNVNLKQISNICSFNSEAYPDCLTFADDQVLSIGTVDKIQKLHIRAVPLNEGPRRIAHQESTETLGVISTRLDVLGPNGLEIQRECASVRAQMTSSSKQSSDIISKFGTEPQTAEFGTEIEVYNFLLFDQHTFEVLHAHQMLPTEYALSLISCKLGNDSVFYYVIGTGLVIADEHEPTLGRIIVFRVDEGKLTLVCDKEVKGGVLSLAEFNGKLLASINNSVRLFEWTAEKELRLECSHFNNIIALFIKTKGDFILVGDLMRSVTLLQYKTLEERFEEIARDYDPSWMTAIEILDDDTFLGAENSLNLFVCQKDSTATNDEERLFMQEVGQFHLGDMVNMFRRGSLVKKPIGDTAALTNGSILFGTISGAVGVIRHIPRELFKLLNELQTRVSTTLKSVGRINHSFWRSFTSEGRTEPATGFIDGDLIECFLDLPRNDIKNIVNALQCSFPTFKNGAGDSITHFNYAGANGEVRRCQSREKLTVDNVIKIVEDLTRLY